MKFIKKLATFFKSITGIITLIVLAILVLVLIFKDKNKNEDLFTLTLDNLAATGITVGGTVVAQEEVDLSFEVSGRVAQVSKKAGDRATQGDVLASLDMGIVSSNILKAQADLDAEIAKLNEYKAQEGNGLTEVETKKNQLIRELQNAYIVAEDSIKNKTDQFFENPDSRFPKMFFIFDKFELRNDLNVQRYEIGRVLKAWQLWAYSISKDTYTDQMIIDTKTNISKVQTYLNNLSVAVNQFEANDTYPQTTIDKYKTDTATARTNMNQALTDVLNAQEALRSTTSQIPYQEARVKSARATVANYQAELEKSIIRAPFTGLVTKQDAKVGMSAFADQALVSMISDSNYGLDTYVPEIYISQIKIGNKAKVALNSYGSTQLFDATVTFIDPAAAERDGVASYKVELVFDQNDERIKSGMTGDVEIMTEIINPAFWIPATSIIDQGGATYVKVKTGETVELRRVEVGERNPAEVEVLSGLIVGDQIIVTVKK
jgi:HlyD family secretion protein